MKNLFVTAILIFAGSLANAAKPFTITCGNTHSDYLTVEQDSLSRAVMTIYQPGQQPLKYRVTAGDDSAIYGEDNRSYLERERSYYSLQYDRTRLDILITKNNEMKSATLFLDDGTYITSKTYQQCIQR